MSELGDDTRHLFELARRAGPSREERARMREAIVLGAASGALGVAAAKMASKGAWAHALAMKKFVVFLVLGAVGTGALWTAGHVEKSRETKTELRPVRITPAAPLRETEPKTVYSVEELSVVPNGAGSHREEPGVPASAVVMAKPEPKAKSSESVVEETERATIRESEPVEQASPPTRFEGSLAEEARLLNQAHSAFAAGRAREALTLTKEHVARFPKSPLWPERALLETRCHCLLGDVERARVSAATLVSRSDGFFARVQSTCAASGR